MLKSVLTFFLISLVVSVATADFDSKKIKTIMPSFSQKEFNVFVFLSSHCPCTGRVLAFLKTMDGQYGSNPDWNIVYVDESPVITNRSTAIEKALKRTTFHDGSHALANAIEAIVTPEAWIWDKTGKVLYHGAVDAEAGSSPLLEAMGVIAKGQKPQAPFSEAFGCGIQDNFVEAP